MIARLLLYYLCDYVWFCWSLSSYQLVGIVGRLLSAMANAPHLHAARRVLPDLACQPSDGLASLGPHYKAHADRHNIGDPYSSTRCSQQQTEESWRANLNINFHLESSRINEEPIYICWFN